MNTTAGWHIVACEADVCRRRQYADAQLRSLRISWQASQRLYYFRQLRSCVNVHMLNSSTSISLLLLRLAETYLLTVVMNSTWVRCTPFALDLNADPLQNVDQSTVCNKIKWCLVFNFFGFFFFSI